MEGVRGENTGKGTGKLRRFISGGKVHHGNDLLVGQSLFPGWGTKEMWTMISPMKREGTVQSNLEATQPTGSSPQATSLANFWSSSQYLADPVLPAVDTGIQTLRLSCNFVFPGFGRLARQLAACLSF